MGVSIMDIDIEKASGELECSNPDCLHLSEYHEQVGYNWKIKKGTMVAWVWLEEVEGADVYCRACIDEIYQYIKTKLDTKLWAFH